jgi:uncharacterized membrane protein YkoI
MKIAASSRTVVVTLALAGSVGVAAALAASASTAAPDQAVMRPLSTAGQQANTTPEPTVTSRAGAAALPRDSRVGLTEASRIAALVGHGRVTELEQETTTAGPAYEMTVVGPDGAVRKVTVNAGTGRVLANTLESAKDAKDATDATDGDAPESAGDTDADGDDHSDDHATHRDVKDEDGNDRHGRSQDSSVG